MPRVCCGMAVPNMIDDSSPSLAVIHSRRVDETCPIRGQKKIFCVWFLRSVFLLSCLVKASASESTLRGAMTHSHEGITAARLSHPT